MTALLVAIGAAIGGALRYLVAQDVHRRGGTSAAAVLIVNLIGSFALGLLIGGGVGSNVVALLGVGLCGSLTTMSTFALDLYDALDQGRLRHAFANLAGELILGIGAGWLGWAISR